MKFVTWWRRALPGALVTAVLLLALVVLTGELRAFSVSQILAELRAMPASRTLTAIALTLVGFGVMAAFDRLGARYAGVALSHRQTAVAGSMASAFSQALGLPLLTGAPVRSRFYSSWGVDAPDIARIVTFTTVTFWLGFLALGGALFLSGAFEPPGAPRWVAPSARLLGGLCVFAVLGYLAACGGRRSVTLMRQTLDAPSLALGVGQVVAGCAHWLASAAALWALLPPDSSWGVPFFVSAYLLAQAVAHISQVPGGIGVFEAALVVSLGAAGGDMSLVPALIAFRAIHHLLPLLVALLGLGLVEWRHHGPIARTVDWVEAGVASVGTGVSTVGAGVSSLGAGVSSIGAGVSPVVPVVAAGTVFVTGAFLLASGAVPFGGSPVGARLFEWLPLVETAHFLTSVGGAGLLLLAWGLWRRLDGAFMATVGVLALSILLALLRGSGWLTAAVPLVVLVGLLPARREFFRRSSLISDPLSPEWIFGVLGVVGAIAWLGFFSFRAVDYSSELWWRFALDADAPRFLRGSVGAALVLLTFAVRRLLSPEEPEEEERPAEITADILDIVSRSPDAHGCLALIGDKRFLRSGSGRSFIMYGVEGRAWISMGDPVGDPEEFAELVWRFRDRARQYDGWPAFYQATPAYLPLYIDAGLTLVKLGEEAIVITEGMSLDGGARAGLRKAVRRQEREGASFRVLLPEEVPAHLPRLREISDQWLLAKNAREKRFSLGSFSDEYLSRSPVGVVSVEGQIVAFTNILLAAPGTEFTADLMRYDTAAAPDGVMLYLLTQVMLWGGTQGYRRFSLGMAPLSGLEAGPTSTLWSRVGSAVFRHGEHFYNFQGLRAFKEKWDPEWEPRYLACPGGAAVPRVLTRTALLVSGGVGGLIGRDG